MQAQVARTTTAKERTAISERTPILDIENLEYLRGSGQWVAEFKAVSTYAAPMYFNVSISVSHSGDDNGFPQTIGPEIAAKRLREKAHKALEQLLEVSAESIKTSEG